MVDSTVATNVAVKAVGLTRSFGTTRALTGISFEIGAGEQLAIMGPSGCGKTTLINLLGALDRPSAGHVIVAGRELAYSDTEVTAFHRSVVGFVFQGFALIPSLTVSENVQFTMMACGVPEQARITRASELLSDVDLTGMANRFPEELSGGQRQRVAIARALAHRPKLILADEPTGNLDQANAHAVTSLLVKSARDSGAALVVVTHDSTVAKQVGQVWHMRDGGFDGQPVGERATTLQGAHTG